MKFGNNRVDELKIAYIGGGSRGWAWGLMSDLVSVDDISGDVYLYDIDSQAAKNNAIIGNKYNEALGAKTKWNYYAVDTLQEALENADFVVISILPGTFKEMRSDVHTPEKYGIYQSVGDTAGPGGILRAMRTVPIYEKFAEAIKEYCPGAWVINYTNPMTLCVKTLYRVFPEIKAFGCCHEVFGTQKVLMEALNKELGIKAEKREEIKVNPIAVNHFTWFTEAKYKNIDLFPVYSDFVKKYKETGFTENLEENWRNSAFDCSGRVKFDLFDRYGYIAAAGDRHLAEFCEGKWYLENPEKVADWGFNLTSVDWREEDLKDRLEKSKKLLSEEEKVEIKETGEEGVAQIRALLGLCDLITNVNIPNYGQIPNLPIGAIVEVNAVFRSNSLTPVFAGAVPKEIYPMVSRICGEQEMLDKAIEKRNIEEIFSVFANDALVTCSIEEARSLFDQMVDNTKEYLTDYFN